MEFEKGWEAHEKKLKKYQLNYENVGQFKDWTLTPVEGVNDQSGTA